MAWIICVIPNDKYTGIQVVDHKYVKEQLILSGFDLSKEIYNSYDIATDSIIFKQ